VIDYERNIMFVFLNLATILMYGLVFWVSLFEKNGFTKILVGWW